jgi:hypothetical protein
MPHRGVRLSDFRGYTDVPWKSMNPELMRKDFRSRVCEQIELYPEGDGRFRVATPFRFEDGDHFGIVLKQEGTRWILSDEASTLMHLSYWLDEEDIGSGNRQEIVEAALAGFSVENRQGEFAIAISGNNFGDALFNFVQALTKVSDVSFLSRERVRSTFVEDFKALLLAYVPEGRLTFDWTDPKRDPKMHYPVDCRINGMEHPLFVYALPSERKVQEATINLLTFERWGLRTQSLGIFEEQERINRTVLAKFTDVCDKAFSSLDDNRDRIAAFLQRVTGAPPDFVSRDRSTPRP